MKVFVKEEISVDKNVKNVTMFCLSFRFSNIEFKKPSFNILYFLKKHYCVDANIIFDEYLYPLFYKEKDDIVVDSYKDINLVNLSRANNFSCVGDVLNAYKKYLKENAQSIDLLVVFHGNMHSAKICNYYKKLNPNGKIMTIMDYNLNAPKPNKLRKFLSNIKHTFFTQTMRNYISNCDVFTVESKSVLNFFSKNKFYTKNISSKIEVLPFGYNAETYKVKKIPKEKIFVTVGRIGTAQKNNELILEALNGMDLKEWKFYFIGPIENEFFEAINKFYSSNPQLEDKVIFTGSIDDVGKLTDFYQKSKVFVLSSRFEGFALVLVEAAFYDNFIVSTGVSCTNEIIVQEKNGKIYSNAQELKEIIIDIINENIDFDYTEEYDKIIRDSYSWDNIVLHSKFFNSLFIKRTEI